MRKTIVIIGLILALFGVGFGSGMTWGEQHAFDSTKHLICPRNPPGTALDVYKYTPKGSLTQKPLTLQELQKKGQHKTPLIPNGTETYKI
jgi:hypothetical protein